MAFVVVVKREEPELFRYLQQHFQEPEVSVLLDRRREERRRTSGEVDRDRRLSDRRGYGGDDPLWKYGFRVAVSPATR
jgi:hypothetical protein